jgi:hypothetical protein
MKCIFLFRPYLEQIYDLSDIGLVHHQWMCPFAGKKERLPPRW